MSDSGAREHDANPPRRGRWAMWLAAAIVAATTVVITYKLIAPPSEETLMALLIERARIAPIPADAASIQLKISGSMFTRTITATFTAPPESITAWLRQSPGPAGIPAETYSDGTTGYIYDGGGGANRAFIFINPARGTVTVEAAWS